MVFTCAFHNIATLGYRLYIVGATGFHRWSAVQYCLRESGIVEWPAGGMTIL